MNFCLFLLFGVKGKKSEYTNPSKRSAHQSWRMLSPPLWLPLPATGTVGAQALARLSVIPALPRLVSAPRTQTVRGSVSGFSGSPHTSAARLHAPAPVKYSGHSSLPHQYAAKSLSLSVMIWKLGKTTRSRLTKSVLPHYRGKEGERGHEGTVMQKNNLWS